jgi:aryl-alcohol dehydrogenase-like predicted oxidoreductase
MVRAGEIGGWGVRITLATRLDLLPPVLEAGAGFLVLPSNLLDHRLADGAERLVRGRGASLVITDPHARGALDGSFLRGSPISDGPSTRFEKWETLGRRLQPVTRLGFLTIDHHRTLIQAAVQFAVGLPGVASVLVRPTDRETLEESLSAMSRPPLTVDDRRRIDEATSIGFESVHASPVLHREEPS